MLSLLDIDMRQIEPHIGHITCGLSDLGENITSISNMSSKNKNKKIIMFLLNTIMKMKVYDQQNSRPRTTVLI